MSRPSPFVLTGIYLVIVAVLSGLPYLKGGLYLDSHEADTYHLIAVLFRMVEGQTPHLDFTTPLGILAFFPIVVFLKAGMPLGAAFIGSQLLIALLLLPIVVYAASSRLPKRQAIAFGFVVFMLVLTMTYLHVSSGVTVAMHYNRWAWAAAFIALLLAFCAPLEGVAARPKLDGVCIGILGTALMLTKITFFAALLPATIAALLVRKRVETLGTALITGVVLVAVFTAFFGAEFWNAYIADLLNVSSSQVRPNVGLPLSVLLTGAPYIGFTLTGIAGAMLIRRAGHEALGLVVFVLLFPGFIFIAYQNFGNDPTWLLFMAFLILAYRPEAGFGDVLGVDIRAAMSVTALVAVLINLPSLYTTAKSPFEHLAFNKADFIPYLNDPAQDDFFIRRDRATLLTALYALDDSPGVWEKYREPSGRQDIPEIGGVRFPMCELAAGSYALLNEVADRLTADGVPSGSQLFSTGLLSAFWLYGDFEPLEKGAPWYYGELTGIENADYLVIPKCVFVERVRRLVIAELLEAEIPLTLVEDNELYALFTFN